MATDWAYSGGGEVSYEPVGSGVLFDALDPAVRRWYVPQELFLLYRWKQWEYTNYARDHYQRYLSPDIEGDYFYDLYGSFITKGWLIYDWRQQQPQQFGSAIFKDPRFGSWFNRLVISSDRSGQYPHGPDHWRTDPHHADAHDFFQAGF